MYVTLKMSLLVCPGFLVGERHREAAAPTPAAASDAFRSRPQMITVCPLDLLINHALRCPQLAVRIIDRLVTLRNSFQTHTG